MPQSRRNSGRRRATSSSSRRRASGRTSRERTERKQKGHGRNGRDRKPLWLGLGGVAAVLLLAGAFVGWEASQAKSALDDATQQASALQRELRDGDLEQAERLLAQLQESTTTARTRTDGPLWGIVTRVPFLGKNADAVQVAADSIDDIAQRALPPVVSTATALDSELFRPVDGAFPLETFAQLVEPVSTAAAVLEENRARIDDIDADSLLGMVQGPVNDLQEKVGTAESAASAAARALRLAPGMLGAQGPRTYLVMFQNNAESRATGGIPGALALVRAEGGRLEFVEQYSYDDIGTFAEDVLPLTEDEQTTFGTTLVRDIRDVNLTPDFPRTAQIAREIVQRRFGTPIDGVLSIDPVALSYALEGSGQVALPDGTVLTPDNAVATLLNTVYARFPDPDEQDEFFAAAAQAIFANVLSGGGDSRQTLQGLSKAVDEHRILMWSSVEAEQAEIAETSLEGALPPADSTPHVGVYVSDATSSKMQYYLRWNSEVESTSCLENDGQDLVLTTTLTSIAPADAAQLPPYITGNGQRAAAGSQQVNLRITAPAGGSVSSVEVGGEPIITAQGRLGERPVVILPAEIGPGQELEVRVTMTTGPDQPGSTVVTTTPGVVSFDQDQRFASACS